MSFAYVDGRVISEMPIRCILCGGTMEREFASDYYGFTRLVCDDCGKEETRGI